MLRFVLCYAASALLFCLSVCPREEGGGSDRKREIYISQMISVGLTVGEVVGHVVCFYFVEYGQF